MRERKFTIREKKFGDNRLKIANEFTKRLAKEEFGDIHVTEVCEKVGLSKVTFFNYFPTKGSVIFYMVRLWEYEESYLSSVDSSELFNAIENLFSRLFSNKNIYNLMLAYTEYICSEDSENNVDYSEITITDYEKYKYSKKAYFLSDDTKRINKFAVDIITSRSDLDEEQAKNLVDRITSLVFGEFITARRNNVKSTEQIYSSIQSGLKSIASFYQL